MQLNNINMIIQTTTDPRCIHAHAMKTGATKTNPAVLNSLITLYSKSNLQDDAIKVFKTIPTPNTASWTSLISAFSHTAQAFHHFISMLRRYNHPPTTRVFASLFKTCATLSAFPFAQQLHALARKVGLSSEPFTSSALVAFYCKTCFVDDARKVFDELSVRDGVCFSSMIVGFAQNRRPVEALSCFVEMRRGGFMSTMYAVSGALRAVSEMAMLEQCRVIHGHVVVTGLDLNVIVVTALIDGYGKCGTVNEGRRVFDELGMKLNLVGWNAMLVGYAQQGEWSSVVELFQLMEKRGLKPDEYSFLAVLTAFSNAGLAEETEIWLRRMSEEYRLEPWIEHLTCLVGAMGKAGRLEEAEKIALSMPFEPDVAVWRALLSACAYNREADMAWRMSERLLEVDPNDDSAYVILANAFSSAGRWDGVKQVWKRMKDGRVRKEGGRSWIEVHGEVHSFLAGDRRHDRKDEIYAKLTELMEKIEILGYKPVYDEVLHELDEMEKRELLRYHSEKLAFAFGVLTGVALIGKAVRIVKNVRTCKDCHKAFKYFSIVIKREIIVRDVNRYHRFLNGSCNCGDCW